MSTNHRGSKTPAPAGVSAPVRVSEPAGFPRATWEHWKKIAHAVGVVQTRVLLVVFYFMAVLPLGVVLRLSGGDRLRLKAPAASNWSAHQHDAAGLDSARRQF